MVENIQKLLAQGFLEVTKRTIFFNSENSYPMDYFKYYFSSILDVSPSGKNIVFYIYVVSMFYTIFSVAGQFLIAFIKLNCLSPVVCKLLT